MSKLSCPAPHSYAKANSRNENDGSYYHNDNSHLISPASLHNSPPEFLAVEHDIGALRGQRLGDAQADAAGGSGNEGSFAF